MVDRKDLEATRLVRREFNRRKVDATRADVRVLHGILYVRGTLSSIGDSDAQHEMDIIARAVRQLGAVREVILDVSYR